jgi:energy-coupling factor transport system substrate-specific component
MARIIALFKSITIFEIVLTMVVAVALGVSFWGWTFIYELAKPFLKVSGLSYLVAGFWIFASVFLSQIVRKPGIALIASIVAAFVESLLTKWGIVSVLWGVVQGLGAEVIFMIFLYKKWDLKVILLASAMSAIFSYILDFYMYDYKTFNSDFVLLQLISFIVSAIFLAGIFSHLVTNRLLRLGLLDQFLIAKNQNV